MMCKFTGVKCHIHVQGAAMCECVSYTHMFLEFCCICMCVREERRGEEERCEEVGGWWLCVRVT